MFVQVMDENEAKARAVRLIQQFNSIINVRKPVLEGDVWSTEVIVSNPKPRKLRVKINAKTGHMVLILDQLTESNF